MRTIFATTILVLSSILPATAQHIGVDPSDIAVGTRKYYGKDIEFEKVNCYYADLSDYRCITGASVTVFSKDIYPAEAKEYVEKNCDQLKKTVLPRCRVAVRFRLNEDDVDTDTVGNNRRRTVIHIDTVQIVLPKARR